MSALMQTYARLPVTFSHGMGVYLYDSEGRRYLDGISGIGVNALGHAHPAVTAAIREQADKLVHTSNLYRIESQEQLAERLTKIADMETCFFGNSGAEANEAAIKLARLYGHERGIDKPAIVVLESAFHGRTLATLSATGNRKIQAGFEPLVSGFVRAPRGDAEALRQIEASPPDLAIIDLSLAGGSGLDLIERIKAEEAVVAQTRENPALDQQDALFNLGLVQGSLHLAAFVVIAGIATDRREPVRRQRQNFLGAGGCGHHGHAAVEV